MLATITTIQSAIHVFVEPSGGGDGARDGRFDETGVGGREGYAAFGRTDSPSNVGAVGSTLG